MTIILWLLALGLVVWGVIEILEAACKRRQVVRAMWAELDTKVETWLKENHYEAESVDKEDDGYEIAVSCTKHGGWWTVEIRFDEEFTPKGCSRCASANRLKATRVTKKKSAGTEPTEEAARTPTT